jgi:hypothetical protein
MSRCSRTDCERRYTGSTPSRDLLPPTYPERLCRPCSLLWRVNAILAGGAWKLIPTLYYRILWQSGILPPLPPTAICFGAGPTKQEYFTRKDLGRGSATGTDNVSIILIAKLIYEIVKPTNESEWKTKQSHGYFSKEPKQMFLCWQN